MDMRKTTIAGLGAVAVVGALALIPIYRPEAFGFLLPFVIGFWVVAGGVAAVGLAYRFGLERNLNPETRVARPGSK